MEKPKRNKFQVDLTPKTSYDKLETIPKVETPKPKKTTTTKKRREFKQVSVLFRPEQYENINTKAEQKGLSMSYLVKNFLEEKGFFDD